MPRDIPNLYIFGTPDRFPLEYTLLNLDNPSIRGGRLGAKIPSSFVKRIFGRLELDFCIILIPLIFLKRIDIKSYSIGRLEETRKNFICSEFDDL